MPQFLLKLAAFITRRKPDRTGDIIIGLLVGVIGLYMMIGMVSFNMVGSFLDQQDASGSVLIDDDYDVESTGMYINIKKVYDQFCEDMTEAMDNREEQIIAENTTYEEVEVKDASGKTVVDEEGNPVTEKKAICNITVVKMWNDFSLSYLYAYINHATNIKMTEKYDFDEKEIYSVCEKLCSLQETVSGSIYTLYTTVPKVEDAANLFFDSDDEKQMYVVSYSLYDSFLGYTSNVYASAGSKIDTDGSGTSATESGRGTLPGGSAGEKLKALFPDGLPQSENEMQKYLKTVQIEFLDRDGNTKTRSLTVHKDLAADVVAIFAEIKTSGFRAYDIGAYTWRSMAASGNRSHHSYGVAIDINPTENYMVKNGKVVAGSLWNPSGNQYSIGPNSVVVQAFQKRGWVWGGTWNSSKDYMHFSYTGY